MDFNDENFACDLLDPDTTCNVCYAEFLDPDDLKVHIAQVHITEGNYCRRCHFCSTRHCDAERLSQHIVDSHLCELKCCQYCTRTFLTLDTLIQHEHRHATAERKTLKCSHCSETFNSSLELQHHEVSEHCDSTDGVLLQDCLPLMSAKLNIKVLKFLQSLDNITHYYCDHCRFSTAEAATYVKHSKTCKFQAFVCDKCCNVYSKKISLVKHFASHPECAISNDTKKQCTICFREVDAQSLKDHVKSCKVIKCEECHVVFNNLSSLTQHQLESHPASIMLKICTFCQKEFVSKSALNKHIIRSHKSEFHLYKYKCVYCNDIFNHPKRLFTHFYMKHKDLSPYTCRICDKKFRIRKVFTLHIKLDHKSVGFVEFDNKYHVFFTAKQSAKPFQPSCVVDVAALGLEDTGATDVKYESKTKKITKKRYKDDKQSKKTIKALDIANIEQMQSEDNSNESENDMKTRNLTKIAQKSGPENTKYGVDHIKRRLRTRKEVQRNREVNELEVSSDEDKPLFLIKKRSKLQKMTRPTDKGKHNDSTKKFTCTICHKYCYTYQNFHNHVSLHYKNEDKMCIKCNKTFKSKSKLSQHIDDEHSTSRLTETLKNLLEKRRISAACAANPAAPKTIADMFRQTVHKVLCSNDTEQATIKPIEVGISVQKFIESFTPESTDTKKSKPSIHTSVTLKSVSPSAIKSPVIKMIKYQPYADDCEVKLKMPVKYKEEFTEKPTVSVKLVQNVTLDTAVDLGFKEETDDLDDRSSDRTDSNIPDVAQEVMLDNCDEKDLGVSQKIVIPYFPNAYSHLRIAHLQAEAPYYKIVKINDILPSSATQKEEEEEVRLPSGTKLVTANPLAHLLGDRPVEGLLQKKPSKTVNNKNFEMVVAKALLQLEKPPKSKKKIKSKVEVEQ